MKLLLKALIIQIFFLTAIVAKTTEDVEFRRDAIEAAKERAVGYRRISFINLISNPKAFHNKKIMISGYTHFRFEDFALYMSKHDADYLNAENAVWLVLDPEAGIIAVGSRYVQVIGVFDYEGTGHMGAFIGTIKVEKFLEARQWYDGETELWDPIEGKGY